MNCSKTTGTAALAALCLAACGGSGGGGSSWIAFNPSSLSATVYEGEAMRLSITGTARSAATASVNLGVVVDGTIFDAESVTISEGSGALSYVFSAKLLPSLSVGKHDGTVEVRVCEDDAVKCNQPYGGSPWHVPYHVQVNANPGYPTSPLNGDFAAGTTHWTKYVASGGPAMSLSVVDGALDLNITNGGVDPSDLQVSYSPGINLEAGKTYELSFSAWADSDRALWPSVHENGRDLDGNGSPYYTYLVDQPPVDLTPTPQTFHSTFTMPITNRAATVDFFVGGSAVDVHIDDVTVSEAVPFVGMTGQTVNYTPGGAITSWVATEYKSNGNSLLQRGYTGKGTDLTWLTADDYLGWQWSDAADDHGLFLNGTGQIQNSEKYDMVVNHSGVAINKLYDAQGPSSGWAAAHMTGYYKRTLNENGAETRRERYDGPGSDVTWFTDDDVRTGVVERHFPGTNSKWDSWDQAVSYAADGVTITGCATHEFGEGTEYWTREDRLSTGSDGQCFTAGATLLSYSTATHVYPAP
jgi:hypothetical protein